MRGTSLCNAGIDEAVTVVLAEELALNTKVCVLE
jgi:hypothetical protein